MKVLVCGGRDYRDFKKVTEVLNSLEDISCIITGCADGADKYARNYAMFNEIDLQVYAAKWSKEGRKAGSLRNSRMLLEGKPYLIIAFPGGKGTANMVAIAKQANKKILKIDGG